MVPLSAKYFTRIPLRSFNVKTYNLYENDIFITGIKKLQFNRVLYYSNSVSHSQDTKYSDLPNIVFSDSSLLQQGSRNTIRKNSPANANIGSLSQRYSSLAFNGRINIKKALFENSSRYAPTALHIRHQSTTANSNNPTPTLTSTSTAEISDPEESPWMSLTSDGIEYFLKDISESSLATFFQSVLETVHTSTGLPLWATIILTTVTLRTLIVLPFSLNQRRVLVKLENAQRQIEDITTQVKKEISMSIKKFGWPVEFARNQYQEKLRAEWTEMFRRENTHPIKACTLTLIQTPVWMGMSIALANMCCAFPHSDPANQSLYSEMTSGGLAWIQNFAVTDDTFILPLTYGLINLSIIGVVYSQLRDVNLVQKISLSGLSILSLIMSAIALDVSSGVVFYWTVSSSYGLMYHVLLTRPGVRKILRVPEIKSDDQLKQDISAWIAERENAYNMLPQSEENVTKTTKDT